MTVYKEVEEIKDTELQITVDLRGVQRLTKMIGGITTNVNNAMRRSKLEAQITSTAAYKPSRL